MNLTEKNDLLIFCDQQGYKKKIIKDLKDFFYNNQYKYDYYRPCDKDYEHDEHGDNEYYYIFYN